MRGICCSLSKTSLTSISRYGIYTMWVLRLLVDRFDEIKEILDMWRVRRDIFDGGIEIKKRCWLWIWCFKNVNWEWQLLSSFCERWWSTTTGVVYHWHRTLGVNQIKRGTASASPKAILWTSRGRIARRHCYSTLQGPIELHSSATIEGGL